MIKKFRPKLLSIFLTGILLSACSSAELHVKDWDRDRIVEIPDGEIEVSICFDMKIHSKDEVQSLAKEECAVRIREIQNLVQSEKLRHGMYQSQAEGEVFQGPVQREKDLMAMIASLKLKYVKNDKWECPLMTPNRITYYCQYDQNAKDSLNRQGMKVEDAVSPELPPELPDDLKPQ